MLGIEPDYDVFDSDLIIHINSTFFTLLQLGIGPVNGFAILDTTSNWSDFLGDRTDLNAVKTYIYLKVKLLFDPPQMGYLVDSLKKQAEEYEWRLNVQIENKEV